MESNWHKNLTFFSIIVNRVKEARARQLEPVRPVGDVDMRGHSFMVNDASFFSFSFSFSFFSLPFFFSKKKNYKSVLSWFVIANGAHLGTT